MHEFGYILRNNCSLQYKEWRHVPNEVRLPLRHKLTTLFDIDVENSNICKVIDSYMARAWRGSKSTIRYHLERGQDLDSSSGQIETWRLTHWDAEKGWISTNATATYDANLIGEVGFGSVYKQVKELEAART